MVGSACDPRVRGRLSRTRHGPQPCRIHRRPSILLALSIGINGRGAFSLPTQQWSMVVDLTTSILNGRSPGHIRSSPPGLSPPHLTTGNRKHQSTGTSRGEWISKVSIAMQSRHRLANSLITLAIYFALSLTFFARMLPGHLFDYYVGRDTDPSLYMWSIAWWPYVFQHHVHPFFTELIWAPNGLNLAWVTCLPLLGIIAAPLTRALGPLATFNLVALAALPLSAFAAYLLCAKFSKSFVAALLGGLVFGFSPYMLAQLLSHMILVLVFPIPLAVYLVIRRLEGNP